VKDYYHVVFNVFPGAATVHPGLECGPMAVEIPGLEAVSSGPTIHEAHSTRESVEIASMNTFCDLLVDLSK
jgi:dipeptidase D